MTRIALELWVAFVLLVIGLLALDLGVFRRTAHVIGLREALVSSAAWIGVGLLFDVFVYFAYEQHWFGLDIPGGEPDGRTAAALYLTGYVWGIGYDTVGQTSYHKCLNGVARVAFDGPGEMTPMVGQLTPEASEKLRQGNYERLFDEARRRVRAWEQAHAKASD